MVSAGLQAGATLVDERRFRKDSRVVSPKGKAYKHVRFRDSSPLEQRLEFFRHDGACSGCRPLLARAESCTVIATHMRELRDRAYKAFVKQRPPSRSRVQDNCSAEFRNGRVKTDNM